MIKYLRKLLLTTLILSLLKNKQNKKYSSIKQGKYLLPKSITNISFMYKIKNTKNIRTKLRKSNS